MPLNPGQIVNQRYRIAHLLGQGGMGAVYRAWDLNLKTPVALKEMIPDPAMLPQDLVQLRQQFHREAQVLASFVHPNLPRVTDFFDWSSKSYLVMDFVEGECLSEILAHQCPLPEQQVLVWARQLLNALNACHERYIIHRDIKPQNIIICHDGRAVLVDFGLVKLWDPSRPQTQRIIRGMGTPDYASPEHFYLQGYHTEPRSDLYSLGATLYHALSGYEPPTAFSRFLEGASLPPLRNYGVQVSPYVELAITRALSLEPTQRFSNAKSMCEALQGMQSAPPLRGETVMVPSKGTMAKTSDSSIHLPRATAWYWELVIAMGMALIGVWLVQSILFGSKTDLLLYLGLSINALILGIVGWFVGDTIFQSLTMPSETLSQSSNTVGSRPTQRLVMSTRKLMRRLTVSQQVGLLGSIVIVSILAAWFFGPLIARIPFLWKFLPSYAFSGPLVYAATGRRPGLAGIAHVLVVTLGGTALLASTGLGRGPGALLAASTVAAFAMESLAYFLAHLLLHK